MLISRATDIKRKLFLTTQFLLVQKDQDSTGLKWKLLTLYASSCFLTVVYIYAMYDPALNTLLTNVTVKDKHISKLW